MTLCCGAAHGGDGGSEVFGEGLPGGVGELGVLAGEVKDIDGGLALGVDEGYLDVALAGAEGEGDLATRERPRSRRSAGIAGTTSTFARLHRMRARRQQGVGECGYGSRYRQCLFSFITLNWRG